MSKATGQKKMAIRSCKRVTQYQAPKQSSTTTTNSDGFSSQVKTIKRSKMENGKLMYLVSWKKSWEPIENLKGCDKIIQRFEANKIKLATRAHPKHYFVRTLTKDSTASSSSDDSDDTNDIHFNQKAEVKFDTDFKKEDSSSPVSENDHESDETYTSAKN